MITHPNCSCLAVLPYLQSLSSHMGEDNLKELINFCLKYLAGAQGCAAGFRSRVADKCRRQS